MSSQRVVGVTGKTLEYEESLPSLPVPPLKLTCHKYLQSVRPCVNDEEFLVTKSKVVEFCKDVGPVLQEKLEERARHSKNWLEKWWENHVYLKPRYPIAPTINISGPLMLFDNIWPAQDGTQITRTAVTVYFLLKEWKLLYSEERSVNFKGDTPYSMSQYYHLFSFCRIPGHDIDSYVASLKPAPAPTADYIIVLTKGRIYKCVILDEQLDVITIPEIEAQLFHIVNDAYKKRVGPGLGSLTCENRSVWAKERERLVYSDPSHNVMLDIIQSSIFAVALDDESPCSTDELNALLHGGNCHNRWFDKSFQLITFKNGLIGTNVDHLACDGIVEIVTVIRAMENIKKYWNKRRQENATKNFLSGVAKPVELEFQLDYRFCKSVEAATKQFKKMCANVVIRSLVWKEYGKTFFKQSKFHPDTFVQMAIQLADYKLHKRLAPTYETGSTRQFYHGRTETVRAHTKEAQDWCNAMENPLITDTGKVKLLRVACLKHDELMREAVNGLGIDRHLLGLKTIAEESGFPTPKVFTDAAWKKSGGDGNYVLSTSLLGYLPVLGATLPMTEDGYGCFYSIQDERINFVASAFLSSKLSDCERFLESLRQSLSEMQRISVEPKL